MAYFKVEGPKNMSDPDATMIAARLRAYRDTANPDVLWPDVTPAARHQALADIVRATAAVLRGEPATLEAEDPRALGIAAFRAGMGALLGGWIEQGALRAAGETSRLLRRHLDHGRRRAERITLALKQVLAATEHAGVPVVLLKGAHTRSTHFPEPGVTTPADIDLLISPQHLFRFQSLLHSLGYEPVLRINHPPRTAWMARDGARDVCSLELAHADNPWSIDVHTSLERFYFRGRRCEFAFPNSNAVQEFHTDWAGRAFGLSQPLLAAYLALNASHSLHTLQLIRLVELVLVARRDAGNGTLKWEALERLLHETDAFPYVYPALALASDLGPGAIPEALVEQARAAASPRNHRVVAAMRHGGCYALPHRSLDEKLMWARGIRELVLNGTELIWPSTTQGDHDTPWALLRRRIRWVFSGDVRLIATDGRPRARYAAQDSEGRPT
jgi:hypothetical protein